MALGIPAVGNATAQPVIAIARCWHMGLAVSLPLMRRAAAVSDWPDHRLYSRHPDRWFRQSADRRCHACCGNGRIPNSAHPPDQNHTAGCSRKIVDSTGRTIIPGIINLHAHIDADTR